MKLFTFPRRCGITAFLTIIWAATYLPALQAQPTITQVVPPNLTNGVSPSAAVVFTFSEAMDTDTNLTAVEFRSINDPFSTLSTLNVWSAGNTVLTCTPAPAFPPNTLIIWSIFGQNPNGDFLEGDTSGVFTTGTGGGGGGGNGTNAITTFSVGKVHHYNQTSSGPPTLDPATPYGLSVLTALASNRTATSVTLTLPTGSVSNLTQLPSQLENYVLFGIDTSLSNYDATYPAGDYVFDINSGSSPLLDVVVNLPTTNVMAHPGVPHVSNFDAAQAVNPAQAFTLTWDAFPGGNETNYIDVDIGTAHHSPEPGLPGALTGTATSFTIPAGVLLTNSSYFSRIGFFRFVGDTNSSYARAAYRATYTEFTLITSGGAVTGPLALTNANWASGIFSFDVLCAIGQTLTVEYTDVLSAAGWTKLQTVTNSPATSVHIVSPQAATNKFLFYRARNGP